jgi:hypothetical protein
MNARTAGGCRAALDRGRAAAAAAILLACACGTMPSAMTVRAQPQEYSPAMSSTVGIALEPVFVPPEGKTVEFHWHANFGFFVNWRAPSSKVQTLGADAVSGAATIYWTYDPRFAVKRKPDVTITVEARDRATDQVLARRDIRLDWDHDTARIQDN